MKGAAHDPNGADIRVVDIDGEPWFPAKDVCDLLGIRFPNNAVKSHCDAEDYCTIKASEVSTSNAISNPLRFPNRGMICVNETGIYDLIGASRKPEARKFRKWVNGTVLPTIRKDGSYILGEEDMVDGSTSDTTDHRGTGPSMLWPQAIGDSLRHTFWKTVDQTVDHLVPLDAGWSMAIALVLLGIPAGEVPVGGTQPPSAAPLIRSVSAGIFFHERALSRPCVLPHRSA